MPNSSVLNRKLVAILTLAVLAVGLFWSVTLAVADSTVFSDTFDSEDLAANCTSLANWTVTAGNVDVIGPGSADFYPGNGNYLDLEGCANGTIQSPSLSLSGGTYQLSFEIGHPNSALGNTLLVSVGSLFGQSFTAPTALTLTTVSFGVLTSTTESLVFQEIGPLFNDIRDCSGSALDDVKLEFLHSGG